jgi:hypothetical protein
MTSAPVCDIFRAELLLTDVSGQPVGSRNVFLAPEDGTDMLSRNAGKKLPHYSLGNNREE